MKKVGRNDPCPCGSGNKYKKCCMNSLKEVGVLRKAYDIGKDKDFYARFLFGLSDIRNCVYKNDERSEYDKSFDAVFQNILEMHIVKNKCFELISRHSTAIEKEEDGKFHGNQIDVNEGIDDELNIFFKDFFIRGEMAIQNLISHSRYMGSNISFFFTDEKKKFRKGLDKFVLEENDSRFKALSLFIKEHRAAWYESVNDLRNKIEHQGWRLPIIRYSVNDMGKVKIILPKFYEQSIVDFLENIWINISTFCEEVIVFLLSLKLKKDMILVFIPEEKRDKDLPVKYIVSHKDFPGVKLQCG